MAEKPNLIDESALRGKVVEAIRAWCEDKGYDTYIWIDADPHCALDRRFLDRNVICLDVSTDAIDALHIENGWIWFTCDFEDAPNTMICAPLTRLVQAGPAHDPSLGVHFYVQPTEECFRETCPYPNLVYGTDVVRKFRPRHRNS